jgi:exopolyphosphatase/guanosine-5'-triphosphate,3'-diphosphate pyrophosphatase
MPRFAVIDLGTNIFYLRIVESFDAATYQLVHQESRFVKLADEGFEKIGVAPFSRGLQTMIDYQARLQEHGVEKIKAVGTAALRTAQNGADFINAVLEETGIRVDLITGEEEAHLIHQGVKMAVPFNGQKKLIMDIGGGSVEFIIADVNQVYWAASFMIGLAVMFPKYHRQDPMAATEIADLEAFLSNQLIPLAEALQRFPVTHLVGTSGTFDVIVSMLADQKTGSNYTQIALNKVIALYQQLIASTYAQRAAMSGLLLSRVDMIVVGIFLIEKILRMCSATKLYVSDFDLKEGILYDLVEGRI